MTKRVNTNLKEERIKLKLSRRQLASELGITSTGLLYIENGDRTPNVLLAIDIARYFGKQVDEMFWR